MKLKLVRIIATTLVLTSCHTQQNNSNKNDLDEINTFGKVKSIKGFIYENDEGIDSKKIHLHVGYNKFGYKKEVNWYDNLGNITYNQIYKYDSINNQIIMKRYQSDTLLKMKSITKLNSKGYKIQHTIYNPNGSAVKTRKFKYNDKGYEIEMEYIIHYSSGKEDYSKWINEYDSNGFLIKESAFKKDGTFNFEQTFKNDENGSVLEWTRYTHDGTIDFKIDKQYDNYGNEIKYHMHGGTIDDKDTYKYIYDSKNNWIEKQHYKEDKKTKVEIREIIYYE